MEVFWQVSGLVFVFGMTVGPILGVLLLLNARDRRQSRLLGLLLGLTPRDLRDRIAIEVHCSPFWRRSVARVDMCSCSREEMWKAIGRWSANLPPTARLQVNGRVDQGVPALLTVETASGRTACCPARAFAAAG
jgi:hypothetical protein